MWVLSSINLDCLDNTRDKLEPGQPAVLLCIGQMMFIALWSICTMNGIPV